MRSHAVSDKARKDSGNNSHQEEIGSQFVDNTSQEMLNPMGVLDLSSLPQIELVDTNAIQFNVGCFRRRSFTDILNMEPLMPNQ